MIVSRQILNATVVSPTIFPRQMLLTVRTVRAAVLCGLQSALTFSWSAVGLQFAFPIMYAAHTAAFIAGVYVHVAV
jgi:hypothetical protein